MSADLARKRKEARELLKQIVNPVGPNGKAQPEPAADDYVPPSQEDDVMPQKSQKGAKGSVPKIVDAIEAVVSRDEIERMKTLVQKALKREEIFKKHAEDLSKKNIKLETELAQAKGVTAISLTEESGEIKRLKDYVRALEGYVKKDQGDDHDRIDTLRKKYKMSTFNQEPNNGLAVRSVQVLEGLLDAGELISGMHELELSFDIGGDVPLTVTSRFPKMLRLRNGGYFLAVQWDSVADELGEIRKVVTKPKGLAEGTIYKSGSLAVTLTDLNNRSVPVINEETYYYDIDNSVDHRFYVLSIDNKMSLKVTDIGNGTFKINTFFVAVN